MAKMFLAKLLLIIGPHYTCLVDMNKCCLLGRTGINQIKRLKTENLI